MRVLVTGTSRGIGKAIAEYFLKKGHEVIGFDRDDKTIDDEHYRHYVLDIRKKETYPDLGPIEILINNAGVQNEDDIDVDLKGTIKITEHYLNADIKSILNIGSASGHTGSEFPEYCAAKGGIIAYTKNVALRVAKYGATCNSIDPGGVITPLNICVIEDAECWDKIMQETPLKRWATVEEIAEWAYFMTVINRFCTGQSIIIDGGEAINHNFIWKD